MTFVSRPLDVEDAAFAADAHGRTEPALPRAFLFDGERLAPARTIRAWRSTKTDRGDVYLKRHWFEIELDDGRMAVVYYDRGAKRGAARWYLYTLS